jgi:Ser/Thr protein kinase RdoA (MazF antagonist)
MFVTPVPRLGDVVVGRDALGRVLRVSGHPRTGRVVISIWQDGTCMGTVRLANEDVRQLGGVLAWLGAALEDAESAAAPLDQGYPQAG